jgi:hypothetical protein
MGRRAQCEEEGCCTLAVDGIFPAPQGAWRGQTAPGGGLHQVSSRRHASLRDAWRGQTVPAGGLHQGSFKRRHTTLHGVWRGQTMPAGGLFEGCSWRRQTSLQGAWGGGDEACVRAVCSSRGHVSLHDAWRWRMMPAGGLYQGSLKHTIIHCARREHVDTERISTFTAS